MVFKEVFAGLAGITRAMTEAGAKDDGAVELFEDPVRNKQPRPEHDCRRPEVRAELLAKARAGRVTHWWIGFPCTSFCSWQLLNGGTRTFSEPLGQPGGPPSEAEGNLLAEFGADLFEAAADAGAVPVAENTAPDGRYPSAWETPRWQRVLRRDDVIVVPVDQCMFGHGPPDDLEARYRKRTWLVTVEPELRHLAQKCDGQHRHVPLAGRREGAARTRCAEAGAYPNDLCQAVAEILCGGRGGTALPLLFVGGRAQSRRARHRRAG